MVEIPSGRKESRSGDPERSRVCLDGIVELRSSKLFGCVVSTRLCPNTGMLFNKLSDMKVMIAWAWCASIEKYDK